MSVSFSNQLTPTNYPANTRILADASLIRTKAMPAAAGTANTPGLDLGVATPFPTTETININVTAGASATGNSVNGTIVLQDSADNSAFTNIATLGTTTVVDSGSATTAVDVTYKLPVGCKRYIRAQCIFPANTSDHSDANVTLTPLF